MIFQYNDIKTKTDHLYGRFRYWLTRDIPVMKSDRVSDQIISLDRRLHQYIISILDSNST